MSYRDNGLYNTKEKVARFLEDDPRTRNSDSLLFIKYCEKQLGRQLPELREVLLNENIPAFETVRRARQKVQEMRPDLAATEKVRRRRQESRVAFEVFARSGK